MSDNKLNYEKLQDLARRQGKERDDEAWSVTAKTIVDTRSRIGYDPVREMTFIRHQVDRFPDREMVRCETCGRAEDCACGADCPCSVRKMP